jgi:hypothetical protein
MDKVSDKIYCEHILEVIVKIEAFNTKKKNFCKFITSLLGVAKVHKLVGEPRVGSIILKSFSAQSLQIRLIS